MVIHWPLTSDGYNANCRPYVGSCELLTNGRQFTVENLDQLYVLVSSAHKLPVVK